MPNARIHAFALVASLAAACGDVTGPSQDGAPLDADLTIDAAQPGTITVTVLDFGSRAPLEDAPVSFFQPDGELADTILTDQDGVASAELLPGGAVVAFVRNTLPMGVGQTVGWAVLAVEPGD